MIGLVFTLCISINGGPATCYKDPYEHKWQCDRDGLFQRQIYQRFAFVTWECKLETAI